jgi:hypothetical protein
MTFIAAVTEQGQQEESKVFERKSDALGWVRGRLAMRCEGHDLLSADYSDHDLYVILREDGSISGVGGVVEETLSTLPVGS